MRLTRWVLVALPIAGVGLGAMASCSNSPPPPGDLAHGCSINSDCNSPLVCVFGLCHEQCAASRDCPMGERCVSSGTDKVCELPGESTCQGSSQCPMGLTCTSTDMQCRNGCTTGNDCAVQGDLCANGSCYSPMEAAEAGIDAGGGDATSDAPGDANTNDAPGDNTTGDAPGDSPQEAEGGPACAPLDGGDPDAGALLFHPSNFDPNAVIGVDGGIVSLEAGADAGGIDWNNAPDVNITSASCNASCLPTPVTITIAKGYYADLYVMNSLVIATGAQLSFAGKYYSATNPILLAVRTTVEIRGVLDVNGDPPGLNGAYSGPGGYPVTNVLGPGGGGPGQIPQFPNSGPGGGAFCGKGGAGGFTSNGQAPGGQPYGSADNVPLQAGSAGGYAGGNMSDYPGASGGALQISAGTSIVLTNVGLINANGAAWLGGGGAGGAILLEAPTVTIAGVLLANGGGGGDLAARGSDGNLNDQPAAGQLDAGWGGAGATNNGSPGVTDDAGHLGGGGGGAGWIRINTACGADIADAGFTIISPYIDAGCASMGTIQY
jgi:hypothetical protein